MKIGILTQPLRNNYGGLIQNYALQKVLKDLGHDVSTLSVSFPVRNRYYQFLRSLFSNIFKKYFLLKNIVSVVPFVPKDSDLEVISENMKSFAKQNIKTTKPLVIKRLKKEDFLREFDGFVVGSDQVWRPRYSPNLTTFFLDFLSEESKAKRISYAASFGVDYWEYSKGQTRACKRLVQNFDAVSVREDSGVVLCKEHLEVDALHVLDPTLLLAKKDYLDLIKEKGLGKQKQYKSLMVYVLDMNDHKRKIIDQVSNELGLSVTLLMPEKTLSNFSSDDIEKCKYAPVEEWINGFSEADFVVTDSFHGTVFSIIFNKPFISLANSGRGSNRFYSLLGKLNLRERLIDEKGEVTNELIDEKVDYDTINEKLDKLRSKSFEYITNSLM
ncbi:polysaccharide pyruvyl transferase family protein [Saccharicrinis sp. 156]|uniref:polysaccharide pyruvyl transferase family protein n=1 Tax=Saccharicrinis sp. 156 TaxID=3417574 RepID=UPI003D32BD24